MISFIWSVGNPLPAGTGGSENYTVGHVRELNRRGEHAQVVTIGLDAADGRDEFEDVPFLSLPNLQAVSHLDGTIIFVNDFPPLPTSSPAYQILHNPPPLRPVDQALALAGTRDRVLIATSRYAATLWADFLDVDVATIQVVHPFAEPEFAVQRRQGPPADTTRILYAGRLSPEKGIYTLLSMLHVDVIEQDSRLTFTATTAGADKPQGRVIEALLHAHPRVRVVLTRKTPAAMAALMAEHDIVVMPSNSQYWHETFGIVSIEAQHAGCRVVASADGGLPETDCGGLILVEPDNAEALAWGIRQAIAEGALPVADRLAAATMFTVADSVDALLGMLARPRPSTPASVVRDLEELVRLPSTHAGRPRPDPTVASRKSGPLAVLQRVTDASSAHTAMEKARQDYGAVEPAEVMLKASNSGARSAGPAGPRPWLA